MTDSKAKKGQRILEIAGKHKCSLHDIDFWMGNAQKV